jgi:hypothetical protein
VPNTSRGCMAPLLLLWPVHGAVDLLRRRGKISGLWVANGPRPVFPFRVVVFFCAARILCGPCHAMCCPVALWMVE